MTSSNTFKKLVSFGAAMLIAVGGSLVAAEPASASPTIATNASLKTQSGTYPNYVYSNLEWQTGTTSSSMFLRLTTTAPLSGIAKFTLKLTNGTASVAPNFSGGSSSIGNDCKINYWQHGANDFDTVIGCSSSQNVVTYTPLQGTVPTTFALTGGQAINIAYMGGAWNNAGLAAGTYGIEITFFDSSNTDIGVATGSFDLTAPVAANLNANGGTLGTTTSVTPAGNGIASLPRASHGASAPTKTGKSLAGWNTDPNATTGDFNFIVNTATTYYAIWTDPVYYTVTFDAAGGTLSSGSLTATQATVGASVSFPLLQKSGCRQGNWSNGYPGNSGSLTPTANVTVTASWTCTTTTTTTTTVVSEAAKPLPVWAAPILKAIPTLSKTLDTSGGKLALTDGDFSSLKSVTIGGAAVAFSIDAKGDVSIPVPAGKGGTTADLIVVFTGGKMTIQEGIKYVEPVNVAALREAPIAGFKGKSTKITGALAESIQYAAQLDKKATTVLCTGYAASKAVLALATARAEAACAYATKANDLLVNKTVKVVVNAKLAKSAAVGIKVHK